MDKKTITQLMAVRPFAVLSVFSLLSLSFTVLIAVAAHVFALLRCEGRLYRSIQDIDRERLASRLAYDPAFGTVIFEYGSSTDFRVSGSVPSMQKNRSFTSIVLMHLGTTGRKCCGAQSTCKSRQQTRGC